MNTDWALFFFEKIPIYIYMSPCLIFSRLVFSMRLLSFQLLRPNRIEELSRRFWTWWGWGGGQTIFVRIFDSFGLDLNQIEYPFISKKTQSHLKCSRKLGREASKFRSLKIVMSQLSNDNTIDFMATVDYLRYPLRNCISVKYCRLCSIFTVSNAKFTAKCVIVLEEESVFILVQKMTFEREKKKILNTFVFLFNLC